jgi:hypothetical protein
LWKNCRNILRALLLKIFLQFFHNYSLPPLPAEDPQIFLQFFHNASTIIPRVEEFGASGLAWRRIVEGIIVEKLWKHLVNAAPRQPRLVVGGGGSSICSPFPYPAAEKLMLLTACKEEACLPLLSFSLSLSLSLSLYLSLSLSLMLSRSLSLSHALSLSVLSPSLW